MTRGLPLLVLLLCLPLVLSGCCTTLTMEACTHSFRHDRVRRIDQAVLLPDDTLVFLVEGAKAESSRVKPFTITVSLRTSEDYVRVPQEGMTKGWDPRFSSLRDASPVSIAPPETIPAFTSVKFYQRGFSDIAGVERIIYLVQYIKSEKQKAWFYETPLFYVEKTPHQRKLEIVLDGREVHTPSRYPFLIFIPLTLALDVATFPIQLLVLPHMGDKFPTSTLVNSTNTPAK